jgi:hypothetical protein
LISVHMVSCMDNLIMKKKKSKLPDFNKMTLRDYPNNPAALKAMSAQAKCKKAR